MKNPSSITWHRIGIGLLICVILFQWNSSKDSDFKHQLYEQKMTAESEKQKAIQAERATQNKVVDEKDSQIAEVLNTSFRMEQSIFVIRNKIDQLKHSTDEKIKSMQIGNYGSADILQYFNNLPDYIDTGYKVKDSYTAH